MFNLRAHRDINLYLSYLIKFLKKIQSNRLIHINYKNKNKTFNLNEINAIDMDSKYTREQIFNF